MEPEVIVFKEPDHILSAGEALGFEIRILLVGGGLKLDIRFFSLFENIGNTKCEVATPEVAFREDISSDYDVLVMFFYNETPPSEKHQENLRRFVESGKGIVVIHSTIASYVS